MRGVLLLDEFLPTYDQAIWVSSVFRAPPLGVFAAITNLDLFQLPLARVLLEACALPGRLGDARARRRGHAVADRASTGQPGWDNAPHVPGAGDSRAAGRDISAQALPGGSPWPGRCGT